MSGISDIITVDLQHQDNAIRRCEPLYIARMFRVPFNFQPLALLNDCLYRGNQNVPVILQKESSVEWGVRLFVQ